MKTTALIALMGSFASPVAAQVVIPCDWQASAQALIEPWEDHTRTFANGAVRLALLDTVEPAIAAMHLLILSPPYDEIGGRQCRTIGVGDGLGFPGITWEGLEAGYDPAVGLTFTIPVGLYDPETGDFPESQLAFTVNQATGEIDARIDPGAQ